MNGTFVRLFREIEQWEWYQDGPTKDLFLHCLIKANYKKKSWKGIEIDVGSFVTSTPKLAAELGLSRQVVRSSLERLKSTNELTTKTTNKYTVITVVKWGDYQSQEDKDNQQSNQQITNNQPTTNQQITTTNKDKKEKKDKNNNNTLKDIPSADEKKLIFGSRKNVKLTADQYRRLNIDYEGIDVIIEWFSQYIAEKGYKSKEHNLSIRRWVVEAYQKNPYAYQIPGTEERT